MVLDIPLEVDLPFAIGCFDFVAPVLCMANHCPPYRIQPVSKVSRTLTIDCRSNCKLKVSVCFVPSVMRSAKDSGRRAATLSHNPSGKMRSNKGIDTDESGADIGIIKSP